MGVRAARAGRIRTLVGAMLREMRLRRDMRALLELDEHLLRDIGLARGGVETAVRHGRL